MHKLTVKKWCVGGYFASLWLIQYFIVGYEPLTRKKTSWRKLLNKN